MLTAKKIIALIVLTGLSACASMKNEAAIAQATPVMFNAEASPPLGPYSSAVRAGDFVFSSGIIAFDAEKGAFADANIEAQTEQAFDNLEAALTSAGVGFDDVVKLTVYLKNPSDVSGMNNVYEKRLGVHRPARTTVPGADWGRDDILIEIDAIAVCRCD